MFIAITIEGTSDVLSLLSPAAPPLAARLDAVRCLSSLGIDTLIRFDPLFTHLFQALYGSAWFQQVESLVGGFAAAGAKHIVCSTGRLSKKPARPDGGGPSLWQNVRQVIQRHSAAASRRFEQEYCYERGGTSQGYLLRKGLRLEFHRRLRAAVEAKGMTYATCQELSAEESDSPGLAHCERFLLPFARKQPDGRFQPIAGCTANCHVSCRGLTSPPCGHPELALPRPFKRSALR
jgi:hypothetical protein